MKITPLDIRKQTFRTVFRGADNEELRVFLDLIATEYENLLAEHGQVCERLRHAEDRLNEYRELDVTLRNSLLTAERLTQDAKEASQREAGQILQDAEWRAKQILEDARERLQRLADDVRDLQSKKEAFAQHLRSFLRSQLDLLENNEGVLDGIHRLADEVHDTVSRTRRTEAARSAAGAGQAPKAPAPVPAGAAGVPGDSDTPDWAEPARQAGRPSPPSLPVGVPPPPGPARADAPPPHAPGGSERAEGLFEISADEDYPPRP